MIYGVGSLIRGGTFLKWRRKCWGLLRDLFLNIRVQKEKDKWNWTLEASNFFSVKYLYVALSEKLPSRGLSASYF